MSASRHHSILIIGGGTAGITVAARLTKGWFNQEDGAQSKAVAKLPGALHFRRRGSSNGGTG